MYKQKKSGKCLPDFFCACQWNTFKTDRNMVQKKASWVILTIL